jgi:GT2 family glycosyltransferase
MRPDCDQLRQGTSVSSSLAASIASVTTAYNSVQELVLHIEALLRQERPLQEIIVVDNASTDETSSLVAARYPHVTLLRMAENRGTGGALAAGLAYAALEKRHDWIWMFDQDSIPGSDALKLIADEAQRFDRESSEIGVLATLPVNPNMEVSSTPWLWRNRFVKPPAKLLNGPMLYADMVITSGSMVRREVIEKIGLPRSDFFIDFVDYEYCLRARSHGYKIVVITRAKLQHEVGKARTLRFLLGRQHIWSEHCPFREYYYSRNITYSVWWLYPSLSAKGFLLLHLIRHAVSVLLMGSEKLDCLIKMVQGFWDGRRASLGIRFRPDC